MNIKIILVNGPPRSGKDTLSEMFVERMGCLPFKFAAPLRTGIPAMFGIKQEKYDWLIEERKSESRPELHGMTPRNAQIWLSEEVMKPKFGKHIFGHIAARHISDNSIPGVNNVWVCSDSGFTEEAEVLVDKFGPQNVYLFKIERDGTSFEGDSRSYIDLPGVKSARIPNNGTKEFLWQVASGLVEANFI